MIQFFQILYIYARMTWYDAVRKLGITPKKNPYVYLPIIPDKPKLSHEEEKKQAIINATISGWNTALSKQFTDISNPAPMLALPVIDGAFPSSFKVWVYNISALAHELYHPNIGTIKIPANKDGKYAVVTSLPNYVKFPKTNVDTGEITFLVEDGRRVAMDLIDPDNLSINQDQFIDPKARLSRGRNLGMQGVFWSLNNPPGPDDLAGAYVRMEAFYMDLLQRMGVGTVSARVSFKEKVQKYLDYVIYVPSSDPLKRRKEDVVAYHPYTLETAMDRAELDFQITPAHHAAAEYFKQTSEWHPVLKNKI